MFFRLSRVLVISRFSVWFLLGKVVSSICGLLLVVGGKVWMVWCSISCRYLL